MTTWLDPADPAVRSGVVSGAYGKAPHSPHGNPVPTPPEIDPIAVALAGASEILSRLTGWMFHPALQVREEFVVHPKAIRLVPTYSPLREILAVTRVTEGTDQPAPMESWTTFAGAVYFASTANTHFETWLYLDTWLWDWYQCRIRDRELLWVLYNAGSTITASARAAVLALAHEYWLATSRCDECDSCALPERTTSVVREGIAYNLSDPENPFSQGHTGLAGVDSWIRVVNPHKATRPSGVWTPDSPPPTVHTVRSARPIFPVVTP